MKNHFLPWNIMKANPEPKKNQGNNLESHWYKPKIVKNHNIKNDRQWWLGPNNRISCDGNMCPKNISIALLRNKTIAKQIDHCSSLPAENDDVIYEEPLNTNN